MAATAANREWEKLFEFKEIDRTVRSKLRWWTKQRMRINGGEKKHTKQNRWKNRNTKTIIENDLHLIKHIKQTKMSLRKYKCTHIRIVRGAYVVIWIWIDCGNLWIGPTRYAPHHIVQQSSWICCTRCEKQNIKHSKMLTTHTLKIIHTHITVKQRGRAREEQEDDVHRQIQRLELR